MSEITPVQKIPTRAESHGKPALPLPALDPFPLPRPPHVIFVSATGFIADHRGALFHEGTGALIVADLHLEKGSSFAARRSLLPPYDTAATLARLERLIEFYVPRLVVALGDSFHDGAAGERITAADVSAIARLQKGRGWIWIAGNHDPDPPQGLGGEAMEEMTLAGVVLRHAPQALETRGELSGHLHPAARVSSASGTVRRRCFAANGQRCILPAFGAYTGGLNLRDPAFAPFFEASGFTAHVLGRDRLYAVPQRRCWPD